MLLFFGTAGSINILASGLSQYKVTNKQVVEICTNLGHADRTHLYTVKKEFAHLDKPDLRIRRTWHRMKSFGMHRTVRCFCWEYLCGNDQNTRDQDWRPHPWYLWWWLNLFENNIFTWIRFLVTTTYVAFQVRVKKYTRGIEISRLQSLISLSSLSISNS